MPPSVEYTTLAITKVVINESRHEAWKQGCARLGRCRRAGSFLGGVHRFPDTIHQGGWVSSAQG